MTLTEKQKKHLRRLAHPLHPVVLVGQDGDSPGVVKELDGALGTHELVKVRARIGDRDERNLLLDRLATATRSSLVQRIGNVGVFYRARRDQPKIILPDD
jgi:RNA-binding protein